MVRQMRWEEGRGNGCGYDDGGAVVGGVTLGKQSASLFHLSSSVPFRVLGESGVGSGHPQWGGPGTYTPGGCQTLKIFENFDKSSSIPGIELAVAPFGCVSIGLAELPCPIGLVALVVSKILWLPCKIFHSNQATSQLGSELLLLCP